MNIFSVVLVGIIILIFLTKKTTVERFLALFALTVIMEANMLSGYFISISGKEIEYSDVSLAITFILALVILCKRKKAYKKSIILSICLISCTFLGVIHTLISTPNTLIIDYNTGWDAYLYGTVSKQNASIGFQSVLMFIRLVLFIVISNGCIVIDEEKLTKTAQIIIDFSKFHICFAYFELLTKLLFNSNNLIDIKSLILGVGQSTVTTLNYRGLTVSLYGLTRESSHLSESMFLFCSICLLSGLMKKNKKWFILSLVLMMLSMSFSTIMYVVCIVITYILINNINIKKNISTIAIFLFVLITGIVFISSNSYYMERLVGFFTDLSFVKSGGIISYNNITSSKVRLYGILETFKAFCERPLFGFGIGTAYANSGIVSMLADVGIITAIIWCILSMNIGQNAKYKKKSILLFISVMLLPNVLKGGFNMMYASYSILICLMINSEVYKSNYCAKKSRWQHV